MRIGINLLEKKSMLRNYGFTLLFEDRAGFEDQINLSKTDQTKRKVKRNS